MNGTYVATSRICGSIINMDAADMKMFLIGESINLMNHCKNIHVKQGHGILQTSTDISIYDQKLHYVGGVNGALLSGIIRQTADILYEFVRDCVLNKTVQGLYLLQIKGRDGYPWELITQALDCYEELLKKEWEMIISMDPEKKRSEKIYNEHNAAFRALLEGTKEGE